MSLFPDSIGFLSTPSARRATVRRAEEHLDVLISIHALREEGDPRAWTRPSRLSNFYPRPPRGGRLDEGEQRHYRVIISIHALREEGDFDSVYVLLSRCIFLSTPSARRATRQRGPCCRHRPISIHALREEGDLQRGRLASAKEGFLSTPSARRATEDVRVSRQRRGISIHALREEGDHIPSPSGSQWANFYPRPPRGGRR